MAHTILMTNEKLKLDALENCTGFFKGFIRFFKSYLKVLPGILEEFDLSLRANNKLLFLVNRKVAVVKCFDELFYLIRLMVGMTS